MSNKVEYRQVGGSKVLRMNNYEEGQWLKIEPVDNKYLKETGYTLPDELPHFTIAKLEIKINSLLSILAGIDFVKDVELFRKLIEELATGDKDGNR